MIPRRIIYAWFGKKDYPANLVEHKKQWARLNPGVEIVEINEQNFDINYCQFTKQAYASGKMAFVSDVARIWAVNKYGGIYLDTDVELQKNLTNIFSQHDQFWAEEAPGMVNSGLAFGSTPDDEVLGKILGQYKTLKLTAADFQDIGKLTKVTTVKMVSKELDNYGLRRTNKNQVLNNNAYVYGSQYFAPLHYWGGGRVSRKTIAIHHYKASWAGKRSSGGIRFFAHELLFHVPFLTRIVWKR